MIMRQFRSIAVAAIAPLALGLALTAAYAHQGMGFGEPGAGPGAMGRGSMHGAGPAMMRGAVDSAAEAQQLMTPEERRALIEKMRAAKTPEERQELAQANRAEMEKRAKERGITLPDAHSGAMGSRMMHGMRNGGRGNHGHRAGAGFRGPMGGSMRGPMAAAMHNDDPSFASDMGLVHDMVDKHQGIKRSVTNLADGIRTVTESENSELVQTIQAHVASMQQRLEEGREFNLFSPTIPVLFANKDKIKTTVEMTANGVIVTQTSNDPAVVAALQAHAVEVSELARDGRVAMMRGARAAMGTMAHGPGFGPSFAPASGAQVR
jgi:hypothetical protein